VLPIVEGRNPREWSVVLNGMAVLKIRLGGMNDERVDEIGDHLATAFSINMSLGLPDGIGSIGAHLAQFLAMTGEYKRALDILDAAEMAFKKLGLSDRQAFIDNLRRHIHELMKQ
jgi:hypothetical protein